MPKKIRSMEMSYKNEFKHVSRRDIKNEKPWIKNNYRHIFHVKHLKMAMQSGKSNKAVKIKLKRLKSHSESPLELLPNAAIKYVSTRKHFVKQEKKKPLDVKNNKKGETGHIYLDLLYAKSEITMKILLHVKRDNKRIEYLKTLLQTKSAINIVNMLKNSATEFMDVFPNELPPGLHPVHGIEHRIDLIPGTPLPNKAPYYINLEGTK
nr:uncharacterized protein LOC109755291 [Aegilops tauschii subsp. strangulata]